jgi:hypothetical protein
MMKNTKFRFKSSADNFEKERGDVKNNTVRFCDLADDRFQELIAWSVDGWNDGDIQVIIERADNECDYFIRDIRDITIFDCFMIITWVPEKVVE